MFVEWTTLLAAYYISDMHNGGAFHAVNPAKWNVDVQRNAEKPLMSMTTHNRYPFDVSITPFRWKIKKILQHIYMQCVSVASDEIGAHQLQMCTTHNIHAILCSVQEISPANHIIVTLIRIYAVINEFSIFTNWLFRRAEHNTTYSHFINIIIMSSHGFYTFEHSRLQLASMQRNIIWHVRFVSTYFIF